MTMTKVTSIPTRNIIADTCSKTKWFIIKVTRRLQLIYCEWGRVQTVKYHMFEVKPQFRTFYASTLTSAKLVQTDNALWKKYELTISGEDAENCLPDQTTRKFKISFTFRSIYSRKELIEFLTGVTMFGFVEGLLENWAGVAVTKGQDNNLLLKRTFPMEWKSKYQKMAMLDFNLVGIKGCRAVKIPGGLYIQ